MPRRDRVAVADANQEARLLRNRIHQYDQEVVLPLRAQIAELQKANAALTRKVARLTDLEARYHDVWRAGIRLTSSLLASGKEEITDVEDR